MVWSHVTSGEEGELGDRSLWSHLGHKRGAEAALVVVGGGDALHHTRHRVVGVTGPAATRRHVEDLSQQLGVQTQSGGERGEGCGG